MADARTFSINDVIVSVDGVRISGLSNSDPVQCTLKGDDTALTDGCNGDVAISHLNNNSADLTLKTLQTSPDNAVLDAAFKAILDARRGSFALEVFDSRGETLIMMSQAVPKKRPDVSMAPEAGEREWQFHGRVDAWNVKGNELA